MWLDFKKEKLGCLIDLYYYCLSNIFNFYTWIFSCLLKFMIRLHEVLLSKINHLSIFEEFISKEKVTTLVCSDWFFYSTLNEL